MPLIIRFNSSRSEGIHFFDHIMNPILNTDLHGSMEIFSSNETFLNSTGIYHLQHNSQKLAQLASADVIPSNFISELNQYERNRMLLKSTLVTICACLRRFNDRKNKDTVLISVWNNHIPNLLRLCLSSIQFCHSLSNPTVQSRLPCLKKVTSLGIEEKILILGINQHE